MSRTIEAIRSEAATGRTCSLCGARSGTDCLVSKEINIQRRLNTTGAELLISIRDIMANSQFKKLGDTGLLRCKCPRNYVQRDTSGVPRRDRVNLANLGERNEIL